MSKGVIANKTVDSAEEFEEIYKVAPPYEAETYYFVEFKAHAAFNDGEKNEKNVPQVLNARKGGQPMINTDLGNGTRAHVQWVERSWKDPDGDTGLNLQLSIVGVVDLVEYSAIAKPQFEMEGEFDEDYDESQPAFDMSDEEEVKEPADAQDDDDEVDDEWAD